MARSPAFQFYPADWLASATVNLMTPAEEGGYIRLLCYEWGDPDCSLPDDEKTLRRLSRVRSLERIRACLAPHPDIPGRLVNPRLFEEWKKQEAFRAERVESGRVGGLHAQAQLRSDKKLSSSSALSSDSSSAQADVEKELEANSSSSSISISSDIRPPLPSTGDPPAPKRREPFTPPTVDEVRAYAEEVGATNTDPAEFHAYWTEENWVNGKGRKVRDWRKAFRNRGRYLATWAAVTARPAKRIPELDVGRGSYVSSPEEAESTRVLVECHRITRNDKNLASQLWNEWRDAGSPPFEEWIAARSPEQATG